MSKDIISKNIYEDGWGRMLLQSLADGIVVADRNGDVVYLNRKAEEILSVALDDIRGRSMDNCHRCPWKARKILEHAGDEPYRAEIPVGDRWLSVTATHLRDDAGGHAGYAMTVIDTTERHQLEAALKKTNLELRERQEKIDLQIDLARTIQKALMPGEFAAFPGARVRLWNAQSQIVGGDVMFVRPEENGGWMMLGDIMGKGLFASQFVPLLHGYIRDELPTAASPADLLSRLNGRLVDFIAGRFTLFITMISLRWKNDTRTLQLSCAGNENPYLVDAAGKVSRLRMPGTPLGLSAGQSYADTGLSLPADCRILCYSDGVSEIHKNDPAIPPDWLDSKLGDWAAAGMNPFVELVGYLKQSAGKSVPHDDQSLMILEV